MASFNWSKASDNPSDLLCVKERLSYSCANTGVAISYAFIVCFMSFYYTDVVGVPAAIVGSIMLISRVFDGISDLLMGYVVDRTHTKMGKARPWILIMAIPHAVVGTLAFAVPTTWTDMRLYVYVFITYNLFNAVTYTMTNIPIWAANCLITNNSDEHAKSGIWMQVGGTGALLIVQYTAMSVVEKLGNDARAWTITCGLYCAVGAVLMIISALGTKERINPPVEEQKISLGVRLKAIFTNKYWVLYTLTWLISSVNSCFIDSGCMYYADTVLGDPNAYGTLATAQTFLMFGSMFILPPIMNKIGLVSMNRWSYCLIIVGSAVQLVTTNWTILVICSVLKGLGMGAALAPQGALMADACNYGSKKAGFDTSGIANAGINFGSKMGYGVGMFFMGIVLDIFKYDGTAAVHAASAVTGVNVVYSVLPIVASVIGVIILLPYDLYKRIEKGEAEI